MWMHIFSQSSYHWQYTKHVVHVLLLLCTTQKLIKQQIHIGMSGSVFLLYVPLLWPGPNKRPDRQTFSKVWLLITFL